MSCDCRFHSHTKGKISRCPPLLFLLLTRFLGFLESETKKKEIDRLQHHGLRSHFDSSRPRKEEACESYCEDEAMQVGLCREQWLSQGVSCKSAVRGGGHRCGDQSRQHHTYLLLPQCYSAYGLAKHRDGRWEWAIAPGVSSSPAAVFVIARLHVYRGALGGGRMVEDSSSIAILDTFAGIWRDTRSVVTTPRTGRYSAYAAGRDASVAQR